MRKGTNSSIGRASVKCLPVVPREQPYKDKYQGHKKNTAFLLPTGQVFSPLQATLLQQAKNVEDRRMASQSIHTSDKQASRPP